MPTVETSVEVDFDLDDYEDDIVRQYCDNGNCLKCGEQYKLKEYINELYKSVTLKYYPNKKTLEQIVDELVELIRE